MKIAINFPPIISAEFAAEELSRCLTRMMPCVVVYNNSVAADLTFDLSVASCEDAVSGQDFTAACDSFRICVNGRHGHITASNPRSILLGVYDYLHTLGCRFPAPGRQYEILPSISADGLNVSYYKRASFAHRGVCIEGADSLENIIQYIDWLPKIGYNSFFLQFKTPYSFLARWYHHENNPLLQKESFTPQDAASCMEVLTKEITKRGLILHNAGHGWTGEALGFSTDSWAECRTGLTEEQQAMTAQVGGVRQLFRGIPANTNLCYANPEARQRFVSCITDYALRHPQVDYLHIWLADEPNNVCECADCQRTTLTDQYIELLNEVDRLLTERGVGTKLVFLLYQELLWPPKTARLNNPDRFTLMFAPISRTFDSSYDLDALPSAVPQYRRNRITLPTGLTENMGFLRAWQKQFSGDSFDYDYHLGRAHYGDWGYLHIARIISEDIKKLHRMGLNGLISCQELRAALPNALPNYVMGYTLFNENADVEALITEYYRAAYGEGYEDALVWLSALSRLSCCDYFNRKGARINPDIADKMEQILDLAKDFEEVLARRRQKGEWENFFWKLLDYHRKYVLRLAKALLHLARGENAEAYRTWENFAGLIRQEESEFQEWLDVYRILEVSGKYTGFSLLSPGDT